MKEGNKKIIKNILVTAGIVLLLIVIIIYTDSTKISTPNNNTATTGTTSAGKDSTSVTVIPFEVGSGWGYKILVNGKQFIYQNQIPVISGYHVFATREQAMEVGNLVADKLRRGENGMVTRKELEQLQIIPADSSK